MRLADLALALLASLALLPACDANDGVGPFDARPIFDASNAEVHELHVEAAELADWPATYARDCADGGRIDMETTFAAGGDAFDDLLHVLVDCAAGGYVMSGRLDYFDITFCDGGVPSFRIEGELEVAGRGTCVIEAEDTCGAITGVACGVTL